MVQVLETHRSLRPSSRLWLHILLVSGLPFLLYSFLLSFPFMCDDFCLVAQLSGQSYGSQKSVLNLYDLIQPDLVHHYPEVVPWWTSPSMQLRFLRPLASLSLYLDYLMWGKVSLGFHLTNVLVHCASCLVIFFLGRLLFRETMAALSAALIFAYHPCVVFGVQWVADRNGLLSLFFGVLGLYLHIRFRQEVRRRWEIAAWLCFVLTFLSKESGAVFLAGYAAYDIFVWRKEHPEQWSGIIRLGWYYLAFCLPLFIFIVYFSMSGYGIVGRYTVFHEGWPVTHLLAHMAKNVFLYLIALLFIFVPVSNRIGEVLFERPLVLLSFMAMVVLAAILMYPAFKQRLFRDGRYSFLVVWLLAILMPLLSISPSNRYLYPAVAPFGLFMGAFLSRVKRTRGFGRFTTIVFVALILYFTAVPIAMTNILSATLKNDYGMQSRIVQETLSYIEEERPSAPLDVVFINLPYSWLIFGFQFAFDFQVGKGIVRTFPLTVSKDVAAVEILGDRTFRIQAGKRPFLGSEYERMFMTEMVNREGFTVSHPLFKATIEKVVDGHITSILFDFTRPFSDPHMRFFFIKKGTVYPVFVTQGGGQLSLSPEAQADGHFIIATAEGSAKAD